jgi:DNA polymerase III sliding clamp (beta) subunit (PCNA family)
MKFTVKAAPFGAALLNVLPHAAGDDTLPILKAVRFLVDSDGALHLAATDRYSLAQQSLAPHNEVCDGAVAGSVVVPATFCKEIVKAAKTAKLGFLNITLEGGDLLVEHPGGAIKGQTCYGEFPKIESLWPADDAEPTLLPRIGLGPWNVAKYTSLYSTDMRRLKNPPAVFTFFGEKKPARVDVSGHGLDTFRSIIMPVTVAA